MSFDEEYASVQAETAPPRPYAAPAVPCASVNERLQARNAQAMNTCRLQRPVRRPACLQPVPTISSTSPEAFERLRPQANKEDSSALERYRAGPLPVNIEIEDIHPGRTAASHNQHGQLTAEQEARVLQSTPDDADHALSDEGASKEDEIIADGGEFDKGAAEDGYDGYAAAPHSSEPLSFPPHVTQPPVRQASTDTDTGVRFRRKWGLDSFTIMIAIALLLLVLFSSGSRSRSNDL